MKINYFLSLAFGSLAVIIALAGFYPIRYDMMAASLSSFAVGYLFYLGEEITKLNDVKRDK